jgi:hypothetical protein
VAQVQLRARLDGCWVLQDGRVRTRGSDEQQRRWTVADGNPSAQTCRCSQSRKPRLIRTTSGRAEPPLIRGSSGGVGLDYSIWLVGGLRSPCCAARSAPSVRMCLVAESSSPSSTGEKPFPCSTCAGPSMAGRGVMGSQPHLLPGLATTFWRECPQSLGANGPNPRASPGVTERARTARERRLRHGGQPRHSIPAVTPDSVNPALQECVTLSLKNSFRHHVDPRAWAALRPRVKNRPARHVLRSCAV